LNHALNYLNFAFKSIARLLERRWEM
jgi:hypothetical protein